MVVCFEDKGGMKVLLAEGDWKVKAAQVPDEDQMDMPAEKNTKDQKDIQPKQKDYYVLPGGKINNGEIDAAAERLQTKFPGKENFSAEELYEEAIPFAVIRELNEETGYTSDSYNPIFVKKFDAVTDNEEAGTADKKKGDELKKDNGKNVKDISVYILQNCRLMRDEEKKGVNFDIKNFDEKKIPKLKKFKPKI
uniref:Nudix hydrolase domain-containing protein n=1 Tax=Ditylenchus dipsaci TaxID=166011 RepID=A0A915CPY4_9BILA